jgi:hypothetical protein
LLSNDLSRLAEAETTLARLSTERPQNEHEIIAWSGSIATYRAVRAFEQRDDAEFKRQIALANEHFAKSLMLRPNAIGVNAVIGGGAAILADRLPEPERTRFWNRGYEAFARLWIRQESTFGDLPLHAKGELLAGKAVSAQRTGREQELAQTLLRIQELLPNTVYASRAQQWSRNPSGQSQTSIVCQGCHEPGRLAARRAGLSRQ